AAGRSDAERARPAALFRLGPGLSITCGPDTMDRLSGHRDPRLGRNPYPRAPAVQGAKYAHQLHGLLATQGVAPSNIYSRSGRSHLISILRGWTFWTFFSVRVRT